jgi:predicted GNAT family acetyltransferase
MISSTQNLLEVKLVCRTASACNLTDKENEIIINKLTLEGSELKKQLINRKISRCPSKLSIVEDKGFMVSWASSSQWNSMQAYHAFTLPSHRRKGFATLALSMLIANGDFKKNDPLAVFSEDSYKIAQSLGMKHIKIF